MSQNYSTDHYQPREVGKNHKPIGPADFRLRPEPDFFIPKYTIAATNVRKPTHTMSVSHTSELPFKLRQLEAMFLKYTSPANADGGLIPDNEYRTAKMKLTKEKASLAQDLTHTEEKEAKLMELSEKTFTFACYARARFNDGSAKEKRAILLSLGSNFILKGKELSVELHLPWKMIEEKKEAIEKEIQEVRTPAYILNTSQIFSFAGKFLTLRKSSVGSLFQASRYNVFEKAVFEAGRSFRVN